MSRVNFQEFLSGSGQESSSDPAVATPPPRRRDVETAVRRLPPLPAVLQEVMGALRDHDADVSWLEERISSDPSLATRLLKMANSTFYNTRSEVTSVSRALVVLGFRTALNLVLASSVGGAMGMGGQTPGYESKGVIRHSIGTGVCAARLGRRCKSFAKVADELFVAGLLHDIGKVALGPLYGQHVEAFQAIEGECTPEVERRILGVDHLEVGRMVLEHWKLPPDLEGPIRNHHAPTEEMEPGSVTLAVALTDRYVASAGFGRTKPLSTGREFEAALLLANVTAQELDEWMNGFEDEAATFLGAMA